MPARSLLTVRGDIRTDINRGTGALSDARIDAAIRNAIELVKQTRYGFNVKRAGLTLAAEYVTLPDDFIEIDSLKLDASSYVKPLIEKSPSFILEERRSPTYTSEPVYYAVQRNGDTRQLRLYPAPDQTFSAEMTYVFDVAESSSWTDSLVLSWFDDGYLLIKFAAMAELELMHIGGPAGQAKGQTYTALAQAAEKRLRQQMRQEQHSGSVEPHI